MWNTCKAAASTSGTLPRRGLRCLKDVPSIPWHLDVIQTADAFYMLISDMEPGPRGRRGFKLHITCSSDLIQWSEASEVFPAMPFGCRGVYRSSGIIHGSDIFVYFSYESVLNEWKIGVVRKRLSDLLGGR